MRVQTTDNMAPKAVLGASLHALSSETVRGALIAFREEFADSPLGLAVELRTQVAQQFFSSDSSRQSV